MSAAKANAALESTKEGGTLLVTSECVTTREASPPRNKTGFLDLPAEIRNEIYLATDLPLDKEFRIARKNISRRESLWGGHVIVKKVIGTTLEGTTVVMNGRRSRRIAVAKAYDLNIMLVCKSTNAEVAAIVLGNNTFNFKNAHALIKFKAMTRRKFALLRKVTVSASDTTVGEEGSVQALIPLKAPDSIRCIKINGAHWQHAIKIKLESEFIWRSIKPFVATMAHWSTVDSAQRGYWRTAGIKDVAEQKKRLESFMFEGQWYGKKVQYSDGSVDDIKSDQHLHEILQAEVLKRWEEFVAEKQKERSIKKRKANAARKPVAKRAKISKSYGT